MARGWESKSVEAQQAEASESRSAGRGKRPLTPQDAARLRTRQGLELSRKRVLSQLETSDNPNQKKMLETALEDISKRLEGLDGPKN